VSVRDALRRTPLLLGWRWVSSAIYALRHRRRFAQVRTYCLFVGHGRSGHSIVGAMLDAHPNIILSDELDALQYVERGFTRNQVFSLSARTAEHQAGSHRRKSGRGGRVYSYFVPGQSQGRATQPRVIGDSRAAGAVKRLARDPALLARLRRLMAGIDLRVIQVVRNPFDTIATMMLRTGRSFASASDEYFGNWDAVSTVQERLRAEELFVIRHEALLADPQRELGRLCSFLGVESTDAYLEACATILYRSPSRSRDSIDWTSEQKAKLAALVAKVDALRAYSFDD